MNRSNWLIFGLAIPVLVELLGAIAIVNTTSGAYAEGFSYLVVLVMLIIGIPVTLMGNIVLVPGRIVGKGALLARGMILPAVCIGIMLIYHTGIWDKVIYPLFPRQVEKIQTASSNRLNENTLEDFFVVYEYSGTDSEMGETEAYAAESSSTLMRECSECMNWNIYYYFVPRKSYDPLDDSLNRENAIAVFRHLETDESATIEKISR